MKVVWQVTVKHVNLKKKELAYYSGAPCWWCRCIIVTALLH